MIVSVFFLKEKDEKVEQRQAGLQDVFIKVRRHLQVFVILIFLLFGNLNHTQQRIQNHHGGRSDRIDYTLYILHLMLIAHSSFSYTLSSALYIKLGSRCSISHHATRMSPLAVESTIGAFVASRESLISSPMWYNPAIVRRICSYDQGDRIISFLRPS